MQKLVPITRLGKFFGGEDFNLEISMGEEWLIGDMNFKVVLYRVDRYKTKTDNGTNQCQHILSPPDCCNCRCQYCHPGNFPISGYNVLHKDDRFYHQYYKNMS